MDVRNTQSVLDRLLQQVTQPNQSQINATPVAPKNKLAPRGQDIIALSKDAANSSSQEKKKGFNQNRSRLVSEEIENLENGFRRAQKFESESGKEFTRIEEFTTNNDRSKRIVLQQNSSGSTTILENILDRQADGTFRQTQRYTDEVGDTQTNIQFNVLPNNQDIILGRAPNASPTNNQSALPPRGTQIDLSA